MGYTHIKPGEEIELASRVYHSAGALPIDDLISLPLDELARRESESEEAEKAIFARLHDVEVEWAQQAQITVRLRHAQQYLKTVPVKHTSNTWEEVKYDRHVMSNMVYVFSWRMFERTKYDRVFQKSVTVAWELSWSVCFNTTNNPDNQRMGRQLAGQDSKVFKSKEAMEKYLQGRIKAYAHLFTEISPPIPQGEEGRFSVNGVLLPGYTVEVKEPTIEENVESLLTFADGIDLLPSAPPSAQPTKKPPAHKPKKHVPTR